MRFYFFGVIVMNEEKYMLHALRLAERAEGDTSPNPMVGCVLVDDEGIIVGEGYHHKAGEAHAEVNALLAAGSLARGATAYVTLEPCSHYGRTGPCCKALAEAGVRKVVAACLDPNPLVAGKGLDYLRQAGIEVSCGMCEKQAQRLNERFFCWITKKRPFITLKYAMTLDGKIATAEGDSKWITGEEARRFAHRLRRQHDAVLVGIGTVLSDDPELTTRMVSGRNPVRIVLDGGLRIPLQAKVLNEEAETIIFTGIDADRAKQAELELRKHVKVIRLPLQGGQLPVELVVKQLGELGITSLLVEGGSAVHGAFYDSGFADRVYAFIAPKLIGGHDALSPIGGKGCKLVSAGWQLEDIERQLLGQDIMITGIVKKGGC